MEPPLFFGSTQKVQCGWLDGWVGSGGRMEKPIILRWHPLIKAQLLDPTPPHPQLLRLWKLPRKVDKGRGKEKKKRLLGGTVPKKRRGYMGEKSLLKKRLLGGTVPLKKEEVIGGESTKVTHIWRCENPFTKHKSHPYMKVQQPLYKEQKSPIYEGATTPLKSTKVTHIWRCDNPFTKHKSHLYMKVRQPLYKAQKSPI